MKRPVLSGIKWLWRSWFVLVFLPLFGIHLLLINYFGMYASTINKLISLIFQIFGGLLVFYQINANIGVIKGKDLFGMIKSYLKECPLFKRDIKIDVHNSVLTLDTFRADVSLDPTFKTIEEKLDYFIEKIMKKIDQVSKESNKKFNDVSRMLRKEFQEELIQTDSKIEKVSIGGIKVQLFGVLLMIYGAISGYFA